MVAVSINRLRFEFPSGAPRPVLGDISFNVPSGDIVTIFGPNGCGKTTLFRIMAKLEQGFEGTVSLLPMDGEAVTIGLVPQNPLDALLPWRSVSQNVYFYMSNAGMAPSKESVRTLLMSLGLYEYHDLYPYQLSGGLRQKLALACATSYRPSVLLLDEPFSALDYRSSLEIARSIRAQWEAVSQTTICICHQPDHSILIGNRVLVLSPSPSRVIREITIPREGRLAPDLLERTDIQEVRREIIRAFNSGLDGYCLDEG